MELDAAQARVRERQAKALSVLNACDDLDFQQFRDIFQATVVNVRSPAFSYGPELPSGIVPSPPPCKWVIKAGKRRPDDGRELIKHAKKKTTRGQR